MDKVSHVVSVLSADEITHGHDVMDVLGWTPAASLARTTGAQQGGLSRGTPAHAVGSRYSPTAPSRVGFAFGERRLPPCHVISAAKCELIVKSGDRPIDDRAAPVARLLRSVREMRLEHAHHGGIAALHTAVFFSPVAAIDVGLTAVRARTPLNRTVVSDGKAIHGAVFRRWLVAVASGLKHLMAPVALARLILVSRHACIMAVRSMIVNRVSECDPNTFRLASERLAGLGPSITKTGQLNMLVPA